jgi:hypothetical protein
MRAFRLTWQESGIVVALALALPVALSARQGTPPAGFAGTWRLDPSRSIEDAADWRRIDGPITRELPCVDAPIGQDDWPAMRYERDCQFERIERRRRDSYNLPLLNRRPVIQTVLGGRLMTMRPELLTEATSTVAIVTGTPDPGPMTFSTVGLTTTVPFEGRTIQVRASWRQGVLVQTLRGRDRDVGFRVVRTYAPSADAQTLTVTTRVEQPKLEPRIKDVTRVYARVK